MLFRVFLSAGRRRSLPSLYVALTQTFRKRSFAVASETPRAEVSPVVSGKTAQRTAIAILGSVGAAALYWGLSDGFSPSNDDRTTYVNWSQTHEVTPRKSVTPESEKEIESWLTRCHVSKQGIRVVGSGLSPNGIAFSSVTMMDMSLMDKVLHVDADKKQVTVQSGIRVEALVEALRPHGLTLQNYASIKEQQIGGFVQVGAHGTGATIPPVDEQVIRMKLITPGRGTIELSKDDPDPSLFYLTRVGLGCFGVVTEVTMQCIPEHKLVEYTFVSSFKEVKENHAKWLKEHRHLRYMWIPYTDGVVVVYSDPVTAWNMPKTATSGYGREEQTQALRALLETRLVDGKIGPYTVEKLRALSMTELRDLAYNEAPLDASWVKKVNLAELEYWKKAAGYRVGWSDEILGFDCGGQQWVLEMATPAGTLSKPDMKDLEYVQDIMKLIYKNKIAAHSPLEQRWTSGSRSVLSPVHSQGQDDLFSWLGIIMYLPTEDPKIRQDITSSFSKYANRVEVGLTPKYGASWHWAKLEIDRVDRSFLQQQMKQKYPIEKVVAERKLLDPHNILDNRITGAVFSP